MPHKYSAENHDWDLTLYAARELFQVGRIMNERPRTGTLSMGFSAFVGSMLLSFSAIESFSASVAFSMPQTERFRDFNFDTYRRTQRFWGKIELLFSATGQVIDKSQGIFQSILEMQQWRNLVTHASPYRIEPVDILNTSTEPQKLHKTKHRMEYTRTVNLEVAFKYYQTAFDYIERLKIASDIEPKASASYTIGET